MSTETTTTKKNQSNKKNVTLIIATALGWGIIILSIAFGAGFFIGKGYTESIDKRVADAVSSKVSSTSSPVQTSK